GSMTSKIALFDQTLIASLLQPLSLNQPDFKAYKTKVKLKISEQRNETSGEKELKFEISRSDDFEFLFSETLNNEKYQILARDHDLTVDFDAFPKVIIQHLLCKNTEINIILDAEKNFCSFELFSGKIFSIKLHAVRGDHLISHLLKICSSQAVKLSTFYKSADELASLRQKCGDLEKQVEKLS
uniref:Spindle assembly abnormal protein 6 n=1 Tax=Caenorhabditis elegans TaxID=6239 RepID=UPI00034F2316|nr:Chain A, Spindle assembly abnormal protein 6 [Caenorhabditis elegans]4GFA_B Chain B, Spindle assembly abnormal protein 6 [Caenorhabditis elegans]4GFA_C Chain C, Spindle assembly abnormal protein 6 [Caenorhabditis elegans]4GFA_D Chain D, Spindle assembly abnormal protein 6 [Caenorhabditis elegans]